MRYISDIMCDNTRLRRFTSSLKRVDSLESLDTIFDEVPQATDFKFQVNGSGPGGAIEFAYTLKKGKSLPYSLTLEGTFAS